MAVVAGEVELMVVVVVELVAEWWRWKWWREK